MPWTGVGVRAPRPRRPLALAALSLGRLAGILPAHGGATGQSRSVHPLHAHLRPEPAALHEPGWAGASEGPPVLCGMTTIRACDEEREVAGEAQPVFTRGAAAR